MMKSLMLASAAVVAFAASPAMAQDAVGSFGLTYSDNSADVGPISADGDAWTLDGVSAMPAFGDWTVTLSGAISNVDYGAGKDTTVNGSAEMSRLFGDTRIGGFVGAADYDGENAWTVGARVQQYLSGATLTGVAAYSNTDDSDADIWTVGADAAFYPMANLRLNGGVTYDKIEATSTDADAWSYAVGAEYQLSNSPISVNAGYVRTDIDDLSLNVDTYRLGVRYSFGGGLQARDRAGATSPAAGALGILAGL